MSKLTPAEEATIREMIEKLDDVLLDQEVRTIKEGLILLFISHLNTLLESRRREMIEILPNEKIHQLPDDVGSPHETEHDRGWNDYRKKLINHLSSMKGDNQILK